jgi:hypothetical protein
MQPKASPQRIQQVLRRLQQLWNSAFGIAVLIACLAILSVIPFLNFLSLGYLLHASSRVARSGRWRDGLVGISSAARIGSLTLGLALLSLPIRFASGLWKDAELVAPGSPRAQFVQFIVGALIVITLLHGMWAIRRGGRLHHFLWPAPLRFLRWLRHPESLTDPVSHLFPFIRGLHLDSFFWLGARGFIGTLIWLAIPVGLLGIATQLAPEKGGALLSFLGAALLLPVTLHLPFLQARFAFENRFSALFEVRAVRNLFIRAPLAFWIALFVTVLSAIPLYLLKIELPPSELQWLPAVLFVLFMFPARILTGWALGRALRHPQPRHSLFRWTSRLALIPVAFAYVLFVYLAQYLSWNGTRGLLEQHAFLVPAPWASL